MAANADYRAALEGHNTTFKVLVGDFMSKPSVGEYVRYSEKTEDTGATLLSLVTLANTPVMQRWVGARVLKEPRAYTQTIRSYPYVSTMQLPRNAVNDKSGAVANTIAQNARAVVVHFDQVMSAAFDGASGAGPTGPDNVALFATNHPHADSAGNTQSNLSAGANLSHSTLMTAETAMGLLTEENGENFGVSPNLIRGGIRLRRRMQELTGSDRVVIINQTGVPDTVADGPNLVNAAATRTNVVNGDYTIVVDRRVTGYHWTLQDDTMAKPMVLFVTRSPEVINQTEMTDEQRFQHDIFMFGIESEVGSGGWFWPAVHRGTGTA
jgi:phage major head subunit gpT-like protein